MTKPFTLPFRGTRRTLSEGKEISDDPPRSLILNSSTDSYSLRPLRPYRLAPTRMPPAVGSDKAPKTGTMSSVGPMIRPMVS